jgi:CRISPR/Cas system-associated exonuclease Cas4 (RecB family)
MERGVQLHGAIESFLTGKTAELPNEINFYTQYLTQLKTKVIFPEYTICLTREWKPCAAESPDRWYKGILDLKAFGSSEGPQTEATVIDWKTGKIYDEHDDQKSLYSLAVLAEEPSVLRVRAIHVYLDLGKNREKTYDREQMHQLRTSWDSRVLKLEEEKAFIPNPSFKCRYCPYSRSVGGPCKF